MMKNILFKYLKSSDGATAIEYALIAAGICLAIAVTIVVLGVSVADMFTSVSALF